LVAQSARAAGLLSYASLSVRIGEQLEPLFQSNSLPRSALNLLWQWSMCSLRYLDFASDRDHAGDLVALLQSSSPGHYGIEEQAELIQGLIDDRRWLAGPVML
jgi:hypothetical protein